MLEGDGKCDNNSKTINELPFEPKGTDELLCKECQESKTTAESGGGRKVYKGNGQCSSCSVDIKELPFEPRETGNLLCRGCFRNKQ